MCSITEFLWKLQVLQGIVIWEAMYRSVARHFYGAWTAVVCPLLDWPYLSVVAQAPGCSSRLTDDNSFNLETVGFLSDIQCNTLAPPLLIFTFIWSFVYIGNTTEIYE